MQKSISTGVIFLLLSFTLLSCGGSSGTGSSTATAGVEDVAAGVASIFGTAFSGNQSRHSRTSDLQLLDESQEICNGLMGGPTKVLMFPKGGSDARTFGSSSDSFTASENDYCEDQDGTANTEASDGGQPFAMFIFADEVSGDCTVGSGSETLTMTRGSGIVRNTDLYMPEIYGQFEIGGIVTNCTLRIDSSGNLDTDNSSCSYRDGTSIALSTNTTCSLDVDVARLPLPETFEGHYAVTDDEGLNAAYECFKIYDLGGDSDGFMTYESDCTMFNNYGFNLTNVNVGFVVGGNATDGWTFYHSYDDADLANKIKLMRLNGYPIFASIDGLYTEAYNGTNPEVVSDSGDFPADLINNASFIDDLTEEIHATAEKMERLNVELFCPLGEADRVFNLAPSDATASDYLQANLSEIQSRYTGALINIAQFYDNDNASIHDLDGFDYAGVNISPMPNHNSFGEFETHLNTQLENLKSVAEGLSTPIPFFITNAGMWGTIFANDRVYDWNASEDRIIDTFQLMKEASDNAGTAGIVFWEGAEGEIVFEDYSALSQYIATEFGGTPSAF